MVSESAGDGDEAVVVWDTSGSAFAFASASFAAAAAVLLVDSADAAAVASAVARDFAVVDVGRELGGTIFAALLRALAGSVVAVAAAGAVAA